MRAALDEERKLVHGGDHLVDPHRHPGDVETRRVPQTLDVARDHPAERQELRAVGASEPRVGGLQRRQRGLDVAGELELLGRDGERLLDLCEQPLVARARQLLVERLERELLALRLEELRLERADPRQRVAHGVLRLLGEGAAVARLRSGFAQLLRHSLAQLDELAARPPPAPGEQHHCHAEAGDRDRQPALDTAAGAHEQGRFGGIHLTASI